MSALAAENVAEEELLDYEDDDAQETGAEAAKAADGQKKGYVGIHSTSFKDFLLKVRLLVAHSPVLDAQGKRRVMAPGQSAI